MELDPFNIRIFYLGKHFKEDFFCGAVVKEGQILRELKHSITRYRKNMITSMSRISNRSIIIHNNSIKLQ